MSPDAPMTAAYWRASARDVRKIAAEHAQKAREYTALADEQSGRAAMLEAGLTAGDIVEYQHYTGGPSRLAVVLGHTGRAWSLQRLLASRRLGERVTSTGPAPVRSGMKWADEP